MAKKKALVLERQAKLSVILAAVGAICTITGAVFIFGAFNWDTFQTLYRANTMRMPAIGGSLFLGALCGAIGFLFGLVSAGEKSNPKSQLSWTGFFISAGVVTLALCCGVFFFLTRFAVAATQ